MAQGGSDTAGGGPTPGGGPGAPDGRIGLDLVFGLAFRAFDRGFTGFVLLFLISLVLLAAVAGILMAAWALLEGPGTAPEADPAAGPLFWAIGLAALLAYLFLFTLIHLATVGLAYAVLRHERIPLRRLFRLARLRFWPGLGAGILAGLGIVGGFILFIVPGIVLLARWWVWTPAVLVEGCGAGASLRRSATLTKGARWTIFWLWLITLLVSGALTQLAESLAEFQAIFGLLYLAVSGATSVFWACLMAAVYVALREREGGAAPPDLIAAEPA